MSPRESALAAADISTSEPPAAATPVRVRVPEGAGPKIVVNTFDGAARRFSVTDGVVEVTSSSDADLLLQRVDGASLA